MPVRLGTVRFLNAAPLTEGLELDPGFELVADTPASLARELDRGRLDAGLLPVAEAARLRLHALPNLGVAARGPVRSVLLVSRVPIPSIRTLALDPASRTSVVLARLLLRSVSGIEPRLIPGDPETPLPPGADAAVLIGDRAFAVSLSGHPAGIVDLSAWWFAHSRLPMVFALWAGRDASLLREIHPALDRALERGRTNLKAIADRWSGEIGIDPAEAQRYLRDSIVHHLGEEERRGLQRFLADARSAGLLPADAAIELLSGTPEGGAQPR